jgi:hypothetical protein
MGLIQERKPLLGKHGRWAGLASHKESRQQMRGLIPQFEHSRLVDRGLSGGVSLEGTVTGFVRGLGHCISTFLHPFAPPALPGFFATMSALTPARRLFVSLSGTMNSAWNRAGLPASCHRAFRSFRLQPPVVVPARFWGLLRRAYRATHARPPLRGQCVILGFAIHSQARHRRPAESSSLALRTNRSPPVALHPASRRRSYLRLRSARTLRQRLSPC